MGAQAKSAQNQELADLKEILVYKIIHFHNRLTNAKYWASKTQDKDRCSAGDSHDQKMLWDKTIEKKDQLALVESEFYIRKHAELDKVAESWVPRGESTAQSKKERAFSDHKRLLQKNSRTR